MNLPHKDDIYNFCWWIMSVALLMICFCGVCRAETGQASWYSVESCQREGTSGVWTASGEAFKNEGLTCAMRSRDFGKYYKVTNLNNGKSVIVKHNDFGPNKKLHKQGRIIDLSKRAFASIANLKQGIINVKVDEVKI